MAANLLITATPVSSVSASLILSGAHLVFAASPISAASATLTLSGSGREISANPIMSATAALSIVGTLQRITAAPVVAVTATLNLTGASDRRGMSFCNVMQEIVLLWGIDCLKSAPKFVIERAVNDLNAAMQMVWNQAKDRNYWSSSTLTVTLAEDEDHFAIPDTVQNVIGPCRDSLTSQPLSVTGTMAELEGFSELYLDGDTTTDPIAYHIERFSQTATDPAKCVLWVFPAAPAAGSVLLLDVVTEPPRYTADDLSSCPLLPIPHQYVESLLLPIARYRASGFAMLFREHDRQPTIDREYAEARAALGLADPLPGDAGDNFKLKESAK